MKEHEPQAVNPKIAIIIFGVFSLVAFLYIRFFASYSSSSTQLAPTIAPQQQALEASSLISPSELQYSGFSNNDGSFSFEYPVEWALQQTSETTWKLQDTESTDSAQLDMTVEMREASGSAEALINCVETCENITIGNNEFVRKTASSAAGLAESSIATLKDNTGYILTALYPGTNAELEEQVETLYQSILLEDR